MRRLFVAPDILSVHLLIKASLDFQEKCLDHWMGWKRWESGKFCSSFKVPNMQQITNYSLTMRLH